ncbi:hypothetical protein ACE1BH_18145 [Aeromonas jandaei]
MNAAEKALAEIRALFDHEKTRVPTCWRELNQSQRNAICHEAELPVSLAKPEFPLGRGDRESLRQAARRLGYHDKFHGCMHLDDWRDALMPPPEGKAKGGEIGPADELARKRAILKGVQTANSGQKKTPLNGAANA